jgi:adenylate cyclase
VPEADAPVFTEADVEDARRGRALVDAGLPLDELLAVERVLGQGMAHYGEAIRAAFAQAFSSPGTPRRTSRAATPWRSNALRPHAAPHLEHVMLLHIRQLVRSDAVSAEERHAGRLSPHADIAVAFADLVGFTRLGESVGHEELGTSPSGSRTWPRTPSAHPCGSSRRSATR